MKEIKQKPAGGKPKTADAARVPKAVVKAAWLQAREAARAGEKQVVGGKDGAYSGAADTGEKGADKLVSTGERVTELAYRGGRKLAERSAGQRRERAKAAQTGGEAAQRHGAGETIAHTSTIEASRPPQTREAGRVSDENRPAGARPQQRESRAVGRAKPIKPGREMKQGAPGPKTTEQAGKARQAVQAAARNGQAKARFTQRAQQTAKRAVDTTKRATDAARAGMRALVEALHSLLIALAAGGSVAVLIVVLICLIAFVAGSAYGIFFAAEAPGEDAFTVQQAVEQLGGEYRDYLQQIESTMPHDRQEIKANDDVYYIRWQDVLAVFSSYVSGAEDGAPVAYLDESRLQQLRQTMWDMNEVAYKLFAHTPDTYVVSDYTHPWDSYCAEKTVVLTEYVGQFPWFEIRRLLSGNYCTLPARFSDAVACYTNIIIISPLRFAEMCKCGKGYNPNILISYFTHSRRYLDLADFGTDYVLNPTSGDWEQRYLLPPHVEPKKENDHDESEQQ